MGTQGGHALGPRELRLQHVWIGTDGTGPPVPWRIRGLWTVGLGGRAGHFFPPPSGILPEPGNKPLLIPVSAYPA